MISRFTDKKCDAGMLSPLTLAFIGDTVFDLYVRETIICRANRPAKQLHGEAIKSVSAAAQAKKAEKLLPYLCEAELAVFKRGRNAHTNHVPKNASERDYHYATGLEALVGWLYLSEQSERLDEIMKICFDDGEKTE